MSAKEPGSLPPCSSLSYGSGVPPGMAHTVLLAEPHASTMLPISPSTFWSQAVDISECCKKMLPWHF